MTPVFCMTVCWIAMLGFGLFAEPKPCKDDWALIFHAPSGNGEDVLNTWKTRHNNCDIVSGICPCSMSDGCLPPKARIETYKSPSKTLRSPFIDYWDCLNINKVKFELNVQGDTVAFLEFDGRGSNYLNWFNNSRILNSSWTDLDKSETYNVFSIDTESMFGRNFFINKNNGVCHVRSGWLVVKEKTNITNLCEWDKHTTYPQFLYSQHGKVTRWIAKEYGKADVLNVYIQN
eukprot:XP_011420121.1 PREDICTED: uncharacterized protein LOC105322915 isoform X2 [Crassostrea gigas]